MTSSDNIVGEKMRVAVICENGINLNIYLAGSSFVPFWTGALLHLQGSFITSQVRNSDVHLDIGDAAWQKNKNKINRKTIMYFSNFSFFQLCVNMSSVLFLPGFNKPDSIGGSDHK